MVRRITKKESNVLGLIAVAAVITVIGAAKILSFSAMVIVVGVAGYVFYKRNRLKHRTEYLDAKYKDAAVVQLILRHRFWQGQTSGQLRDALGNPAQVDTNLLKTRKREIWKYRQRGVNRFGLRITLDDDIVVGWDEKA